MKFLPFILAVLWFSVNSFSQGNLSPLALEIQTYKNNKAGFQAVSPFDKMGNVKSSGQFSTSLADGQLLKLNAGSLQSIVKNNEPTLLFEIPREGEKPLKLELARHELLTSDFKVVTSGSDGHPVDYQPGIHYRGIVQNSPHSLVAISIFEDEIMGVISTPQDGNMVFGKIGEGKTDAYIFYKEKDLLAKPAFNCAVEDPVLTPELMQQLKEVSSTDHSKSLTDCVRAYLECEYDMFVEKGSVEATVNHMTGLFNVVAAIYQNESLTTNISEIFVWTTPDSYATTSTFSAYVDFRDTRTSYNGDLAVLVSRGAPTGGGIAGVDNLCSAYAYSYAYIASSYEQIPTYSWSVHVVSHEMGHILGSFHTHSCVWNGNYTAIDGCGPAAGSNEGCDAPLPEAGTIMSYCQGVSPLGVDFSLGFGPQPGDLIRSRVANATCLSSCEPTVPAEPACGMEVLFEITKIDCFGGANGSMRAVPSGGEAPFSYLWSTGSTTDAILEIPAGTYSVTVTDATGCEIYASSILNQPSEMDVAYTIKSPTFPGASDGSIDVSITGGYAPLSCSWSNGAATEDLAGLEEGEYSVLIADSKGCEVGETFRLQAYDCADMVSTFPYLEGFENDIEFGTQNDDDDFDWTIFSGKTPTKKTGPKKAYNGSFYIYTEATGHNNKTAIITSKCFDLSELLDPVLSFAYHMDGKEMGTLNLEISKNHGAEWTKIWSLSGNHHNKWRKETIELSAYSEEVVQIRFVGEVEGDRSDMAIDDITVSNQDYENIENPSSVLTSKFRFALYPNPTSQYINVSVQNETAQTGDICFTNIAGKVVKNLQMDINKGSNKFNFDISDLREGMYFLTLKIKGNKNITERLVILR